jgi:hypothetical protein
LLGQSFVAKLLAYQGSDLAEDAAFWLPLSDELSPNVVKLLPIPA